MNVLKEVEIRCNRSAAALHPALLGHCLTIDQFGGYLLFNRGRCCKRRVPPPVAAGKLRHGPTINPPDNFPMPLSI